MARPKVAKKPSKKSLARRAKKELRRKGNFIYLTGGDDTFTPIISGTGIDVVYGDLAQTGVVVTAGTSAGVVQSTTVNSGATTMLTDVGVGGLSLAVTRIRIESLDEGVTWHVADTLEPAMNNGGVLIIGTSDSGPAPASMAPGSGVYSFEIESRWTTAEEAGGWWQHHQAMSEARDLAQRDGQSTSGFALAWGEYRHDNGAVVPVDNDPLVETRLAVQRAQERAERLVAQRAESERRWREEHEAREAAQARAKQLLESHLACQQRHDLERNGGFWVKSQFGNRYWVTLYTAVRFDDRGVALQRYCIHATDPSIPPADNALLRMLLLKCDESEFLRTANPGLPSEWDIRRSTSDRIVTVPTGGPLARTAGGITVTGGTGVGGVGGAVNITTASSAWTITPGHPLVRFINGVYRPLCG